jgi:hypothetical protein
MRSSTRLQLSAGIALLVSLAAPAAAHIELLAPKKRVAGLKTGPCGERDSVRGDDVCEYRPGATITVAWDETVDHPGHYRIAFDEDGDDDFFDPASFDDVSGGPGVLLDGIGDRDVGGDDRGYTQDITLPSVECDNCTLQVVQMMTDKAPYGDGNDLYYQCADIVLSESAPEVPAAGCTADGAGGGDGGVTDGDSDEGGCAAGRGAGPSGGWILAAIGAAVALTVRLRRSRA